MIITYVICSIWTDVLKVMPFISAIILVVTFIISQFIGHYSRKKELRRTWYYKAYLDKSIDKVSEFISGCSVLMKTSFKDLEAIAESAERENYIAEKLESISDNQREFTFQVINPLRGAYPEVFDNVGYILESNYDLHSNSFEADNLNDSAFKEYQDKVAEIKNALLTFMSLPVLKNKQARRLQKQLAAKNPIKEEVNGGILFVGFMLFIGALIFCFVVFSFADDGIHRSSKKDALINAQEIVITKLLSPSTADFSMNYEQQVKSLQDSEFYISSYLDSQNIYGAIIRTKFTCNAKFEEKTGKYIIYNLKLFSK